MELVDAVDDSDRVIGQVARADAARLRANVRVVQVYAFNTRGHLLIHELAASKKYAGAWGASVAGGVRAGETPLHAAKRELREELGTRATRLIPLGKVRVEDDGITKFVSVFACGLQGEMHPLPAEIARVEWLEVSIIQELMRSGERRFTPTFRSTFAALGRAHLVPERRFVVSAK